MQSFDKATQDFFQSLGLNITGNSFDTRELITKRKEFNKARKAILKILLLERPAQCQLQLFDQCEGRLVVDHLIPLSSNELNKHIYKLSPERGRKILSASFGSNHPDNLLLACERCNNFKKHRFVRRTKEGKLEIFAFK